MHTVLVHATIMSRRSADRSLARSQRPLLMRTRHGSMGWTLTTYAVLRGERGLGAAISQWKLLWSCRAADLYGEHTTAAVAAHVLRPFDLLDEELGKFVGVDVSWGLYHVTSVQNWLTLSILDPSRRRVLRPSRRTKPFAAKGSVAFRYRLHKPQENLLFRNNWARENKNWLSHSRLIFQESKKKFERWQSYQNKHLLK